MVQDALILLQLYALHTKELKLLAKRSQVPMVFVIMLQMLQQPQFASQELVLLIKLLHLMLLVLHGKQLVCGLEPKDVKTQVLVGGLPEQLIHAHILKQLMAHVQGQDLNQQFAFPILKYVIKHLIHSPLILSVTLGIRVV